MNFLELGKRVQAGLKKWSSKAVLAAHDRALQIAGGEAGLHEIFKQHHAHTLSRQAGIVEDLAAGVPIAQLKSARRASLFGSHDEFQTAKDRLQQLLGGRAQMLAFFKERGGFGVANQEKVVFEELKRRGEGQKPSSATNASSKPVATPTTSATTTPPKSATPAVAPAPAALAPSLKGRARFAAAVITQAKGERPANHIAVPLGVSRVQPAAPAPAKPDAAKWATVRRPDGKPQDGALAIEDVRARTAQIFGSAPSVTRGQNESSQWQDLACVFLKGGHSVPWSCEVSVTNRQIACDYDHAFARRETAIKKLFPSD